MIALLDRKRAPAVPVIIADGRRRARPVRSQVAQGVSVRPPRSGTVVDGDCRWADERPQAGRAKSVYESEPGARQRKTDEEDV